MEHRTLDKIREIASVRPDAPGTIPLTAQERLQRWAELLASEPTRRLNTLEGTEYARRETRAKMRRDDSPISVAFADPVLRGDGLRNDTYGEAKRYFELSDSELHDIVCYCHLGASMTAEMAERLVRSTAAGGGLVRAIRNWFD